MEKFIDDFLKCKYQTAHGYSVQGETHSLTATLVCII